MLQIIKAANIIISEPIPLGSSIKFGTFLENLKLKILQDEEKWRSCCQTRFLLLKRSSDIKKIQSIMEPGSTVKNTELSDRGFFLGSALKHIDEAIWAKVDKDLYMRNFAKIGAEVASEDV